MGVWFVVRFYNTVLQCMYNIIDSLCNQDSARVVVTKTSKSVQTIYNCSLGQWQYYKLLVQCYLNKPEWEF